MSDHHEGERCRELERENRHLRQELARLQASLGRARPRADHTHKLELIGRLVRGITHDFNNVLSVVIANASMLEDPEVEPDELRECVDNIVAAGEQGSLMVQKLVTFARQHEVRPAVAQLNQVVASVERLLRLLAGSRIQFDTRYDDRAGAIEVDAHQLEQVLMNLVVNSRDACGDTGTIRVHTGRFELERATPRCGVVLPPGAYSLVAVTDDGPGIPEHVRRHLFEPLVARDGAVRGTALGLATVRSMVEHNHGHVLFETSSCGTRFEIVFPAVDEHASLAPRRTHARHTVLLVEDDDILRGALATVLERRGFGVILAISGHQAFELIDERGHEVDILLTDMVLPGPRGPELVRRFLSRFPEGAALVMTGYGADAAGWPDDLPAVEILTKPVLPAQLIQAIRDQLSVRTRRMAG